KSDSAFVNAGSLPVVFPGDPTAGEEVDVNEQQNEWPVFLAYENGGYDRVPTHDGDGYFATYTIRLAITTTRDDQQRALAELRAIRPHVHRVWWSNWLNGRFAGTVRFLGDPRIGSGQAPFRWQLDMEGDWGGVPVASLVYDADITVPEALV